LLSNLFLGNSEERRKEGRKDAKMQRCKNAKIESCKDGTMQAGKMERWKAPGEVKAFFFSSFVRHY